MVQTKDDWVVSCCQELPEVACSQLEPLMEKQASAALSSVLVQLAPFLASNPPLPPEPAARPGVTLVNWGTFPPAQLLRSLVQRRPERVAGIIQRIRPQKIPFGYAGYLDRHWWLLFSFLILACRVYVIVTFSLPFGGKYCCTVQIWWCFLVTTTSSGHNSERLSCERQREREREREWTCHPWMSPLKSVCCPPKDDYRLHCQIICAWWFH